MGWIFSLVRQREKEQIVLKFSRGQVDMELFNNIFKIGDVILFCLDYEDIPEGTLSFC